MRESFRWDIAEPCPESMLHIARSLRITPILGQILWNRGIRDEVSARVFLAPALRELTNPESLPGMRVAVERTFTALKLGEAVTIYGDYDVDGVTSVAMLYRVLKALGMKEIKSFLPDRFDEGYGLTPAGVERCLSEGIPSLLIVLDCGTNSRNEVETLRAKGVDVVILDHHEPSNPASALALINYKFTPAREQNTDYCTAGLVFKFCHALLKMARDSRWPGADGLDLREYLDLVALATVSDIAPLTGENRILTRYGLRQLGRSCWQGMKSLVKISGATTELGVYDCGFKLGPRLNAAGRLESAMDSLRLLLTENKAEADDLAQKLDSINRERQEKEARMLLEAQKDAESQILNDADTRVIVVARPGWHEGVVGIVASRLMRDFNRPAFVVALDSKGRGKGSGRSMGGFDLALAVEATRSFLLRGGGHALAAGVFLEAQQLDAWRKALQVHARRDQKLDDGKLCRTIPVDVLISLEQLNMEVWGDLQKLEPCGMGNPRPLLATRGVEVLTEPKAVGSDKRHLKLCLGQKGGKFDAIAFGKGGFSAKKGDRLDVIFELQLNEYQGRKSLQMNVRDIKRSARS